MPRLTDIQRPLAVKSVIAMRKTAPLTRWGVAPLRKAKAPNPATTAAQPTQKWIVLTIAGSLMTELFQALMISSGGLTDRLRRLADNGLIAREACKADGRSLMVRLTAKGKSLIDQAFAEDMLIERAMLRALGKAEREQLAYLLAKLLADLEHSSRA